MFIVTGLPLYHKTVDAPLAAPLPASLWAKYDLILTCSLHVGLNLSGCGIGGQRVTIFYSTQQFFFPQVIYKLEDF